MADKEPLLRIAVTRDLTTALHQSPVEDQEGVVDKESEWSIEQPRPNDECETKYTHVHCIDSHAYVCCRI